MAIKGFMESSLATSEIFDGINNSIEGGENTVQKAVNLIKTAKHLESTDIEAAYITLKHLSDSLTIAAVQAFDNGKIVLIYNENAETSVTKTLPFITMMNKAKGEHVTYVFMRQYISISRDGMLSLRAPDLRDLLTGALISNALRRNYDTLANNPYLQKILMEMYCKFFTRVINREFSIAADRVTFDVVQYWVNKFFLIRILGAKDSPENIENLASSHFKYIDEFKIQEIRDAYNDIDPVNISSLLKLLSNASPRMKSINMLRFLSDWITYYYTPSALALDTIDYFIFMCLTLLNGNGIISVGASDIVKEAKGIKSFKSELLKIVQ